MGIFKTNKKLEEINSRLKAIGCDTNNTARETKYIKEYLKPSVVGKESIEERINGTIEKILSNTNTVSEKLTPTHVDISALKADELTVKNVSLKEITVNHPSHYQGRRECIDEMVAMFGIEDTKAFCRLNVFKYRYRAGRKAESSKEQDLQKAEWYMDKLIELERMGYGESKNMSKM